MGWLLIPPVFFGAVVAFSLVIGGGSATCKVQESADGSTNWVDIVPDRLNGALVAASANSVQTVGLTDINGLNPRVMYELLLW